MTGMRPAPVLPPAVDAVLCPALACETVPGRVGGVEVCLVLLVASCGIVGAVWVLCDGCVDQPIAKA
jgi:hypothetical protein